MRRGFALAVTLGASTVLAGCVQGDRVTLMTHSDGGEVGEVAVIDEETEQDLAVLNRANQQAKLTGRAPRVRDLDGVNPEYQELINSLPVASDSAALPGFSTGVGGLTEAHRAAILGHMCKVAWQGGCTQFYPAKCGNPGADQDADCPPARPGYQVLVRGFTDSEGDEALNSRLSQERAEAVAAYMREQGYEVAAEDVLGMGEFSARRANGDEVPDPDYRRVDVVIR